MEGGIWGYSISFYIACLTSDTWRWKDSYWLAIIPMPLLIVALAKHSSLFIDIEMLPTDGVACCEVAL